MRCYIYDEAVTKKAIREFDKASDAFLAAYIRGDYSVLPPYPMAGIAYYTQVEIPDWEY